MDEDRRKFNVEFDPVSSGWGSIRIQAGRHEIGISTSYAFDPHEDLIKWLDEIISSKPESSVEIDEEGHIIEMVVRQKPEDGFLTFVIKDYDFPEELGSQEYLRILLEKGHFIKTFLNAYKYYLESKFNPKDWTLIDDAKMPNWLSLLCDVERKYYNLTTPR